MKISAFIIILLSAVLVLNCKNHKSVSKNEGTVGTAQVPEDLKIVLGSGGGFTGRWQGYTIYADGTLESWEGRWAEQNPVILEKKLSKNEVYEIWAEIEALEFFDNKTKETGNKTSIFEVSTGSQKNRVTWVSGVEGRTEPKNKIESFYWNINKMINRRIK